MKWGPFRLCAFLILLVTVPESTRATPTGLTERMATAPTDPNTAAALVERRVWVTRDGGLSWTLGGDVKRADIGDTTLAEESSNLGTADDYAVDAETANADDPLETGGDDRSPPDEEEISLDGRQERVAGPLAISDTGVWALATTTLIITGSATATGQHQIALSGVRGLLFDSEEHLFALTDHALEMFNHALSDKRPRRRWRFVDAVAIARGPAADRAVVLDARGLWQVSTDGDDTEPRLLARLDAGSAATPETSPSEKGVVMGYIVVSRGELRRVRLKGFSPNGTSMSICMVSTSVTEVLVDKAGEIRVHSSRDGWSVLRGSGFRPLLERAMAVDADGGLWTGTDSGPKPPLERSRGRGAVALGPGRADASVSRSFNHPLPPRAPGYSLMDPFPLPPRCRVLALNPAPSLRAFVSENRSVGRLLEAAPRREGANLRTAVVFGFTLTWKFEPVADGACLRRWQTFHHAKYRREERAAHLFGGWLDATARQDAVKNMRDAISHRMEMEKLERLVGLAGGSIQKRR